MDLFQPDKVYRLHIPQPHGLGAYGEAFERNGQCWRMYAYWTELPSGDHVDLTFELLTRGHN